MESTRGDTVTTPSEVETRRIGQRFASKLPPGTLVILTGVLGAGKTAFVHGMAAGLGIDPDDVRSPSFTLVNEYGPSSAGRLLVHIDLYRLDDPGEVEELGIGDYLADGAVVAVEWGEKLPARLRAEALIVSLADDGGDNRRVTIPPGYSSPSQ